MLSAFIAAAARPTTATAPTDGRTRTDADELRAAWQRRSPFGDGGITGIPIPPNVTKPQSQFERPFSASFRDPKTAAETSLALAEERRGEERRRQFPSAYPVPSGSPTNTLFQLGLISVLFWVLSYSTNFPAHSLDLD